MTWETITHYAGLDVARYRDFSAFALGILERDRNVQETRLVCTNTRRWPHVEYSVIAADVRRYCGKFGIAKVCVD